MEPVALVILLLLLATRGKGGGPVAPKPKPQPKPVPLPKPKPKPKEPVSPQPVPVPKPAPEPADLSPTGEAPPPGGLVVTPDCKDATVSATFMQGTAAPALQALAQSGIGLPVYTEAQADRSMDAAVRTVLAESAGVSCIQDIPWLDRYVKAHPIPKPLGYPTAAEYFQALKEWDDAWDLTLKQWVQGHPKFAAKVMGPLYTMAATIWAGANNIDVAYGMDGQPPPKVTADDVKVFRALGYDITPDVVGDFQAQYNVVRDFVTSGQAAVFGLLLKEDDNIGPMTRAAMQWALGQTGPNRSWPAVVHAALTG